MHQCDNTFARYYDLIAGGLAGDVTFYVEEAKNAGGPVLEIGCGTGRLLMPIAEAGINIVGIDNSPDMLAKAREKIGALNDETGRRIQLLEADMRDFSISERFSLITIPYRAFMSMLTPQDQYQALACIWEHLSDDGKLILNFFDCRYDIVASGLDPNPERKKIGEQMIPLTGNKLVWWENRWYEPEPQLTHIIWNFEETDESGHILESNDADLTLRWINRYEMQYLLELCGFQVEVLYGDFMRGPFRYGGEQIWIARKK